MQLINAAEPLETETDGKGTGKDTGGEQGTRGEKLDQMGAPTWAHMETNETAKLPGLP